MLLTKTCYCSRLYGIIKKIIAPFNIVPTYIGLLTFLEDVSAVVGINLLSRSYLHSIGILITLYEIQFSPFLLLRSLIG